MAANTFGRQVIVPLTNGSGGGVIAGDVVIINTAANDGFTTTTSAATTAIIGIAQETIANAAIGRVLLGGYAALVNVNASVTRGEYGGTHTVAKQAASLGATRIAGAFCQFLTGGTTPDAHIWPSDLGGGSGAPTNADYLVGTANGSLSAEIVVGTTPGGELGNTWASPTVDAVHSGTMHPVLIAYEGLGADVDLPTGGTYVTALSRSLSAGTYEIHARIQFKTIGTNTSGFAALLDDSGATIYVEGAIDTASVATGFYFPVNIFASIVLSGTTTVRLRGKGTRNGEDMMRNIASGTSNLATCWLIKQTA